MPVEISVVIPVLNEEDSILPLAREVARALDDVSRPFELVFVDDASTDSTWDRIQEAHRFDARVRGLRHAENSGQSAALWAGFQDATGSIIATLDGDGQNDPADLPVLLGELEHADFISGSRVHRRDNWLRRVSSRIARRARRTVLGQDLHDTGCGIRVFKRSALDGIFPFHGWHRFLPLLAHGQGAITREVPVHHRPRASGISKYGVWNRLGRGILDLFAVAWYQRRRLRPGPCTRFPSE